MAGAQVARVFERYWQASETAAKGTGLGLSIARTIVEAHGGTLRVTSEPGAGCTFSMSIPLCFGKGSERRSASGSRKRADPRLLTGADH